MGPQALLHINICHNSQCELAKLWSQSIHVSLTKQRRESATLGIAGVCGGNCRSLQMGHYVVSLGGEQHGNSCAGSNKCHPSSFSPPPLCLQYARTQRRKREHRPTQHTINTSRKESNEPRRAENVLVFSRETPPTISQTPKQWNLPMMTSPVAVVIMIAPCVYRAHCFLLSAFTNKSSRRGGGALRDLISHCRTPWGSVHDFGDPV